MGEIVKKNMTSYMSTNPLATDIKEQIKFIIARQIAICGDALNNFEAIGGRDIFFKLQTLESLVLSFASSKISFKEVDVNSGVKKEKRNNLVTSSFGEIEKLNEKYKKAINRAFKQGNYNDIRFYMYLQQKYRILCQKAKEHGLIKLSQKYVETI